MILLLLACVGADTDSALPPEVGTVALTDADNPPVEVRLDLGSFELNEARDATVDWSGLTTDLRGDRLDPMSIGIVRLDLFPSLDAETIELALARGGLRQADIALSAVGNLERDGPQARLSQFTIGLESFDPTTRFVASAGTWMITVQPPTAVEGSTHAFLVPVPSGSDVAMVVNTTSTLTVSADFGARPAVPFPASGARLDWSALTADARGGALDVGAIGTARLLRYEGSFDAASAGFPDHAALALDVWSATAGDDGVLDTAALENAAGDPPPELDDASSWLFELGCAGCGELAPPVLIRLDPTAG